MDNLLLASARLFYEGKYQESLDSVDQYFVAEHGQKLFLDNSFDAEITGYCYTWDNFFDHHLCNYPAGIVNLGLVYRAVWEVFPSTALPSILVRLDYDAYAQFFDYDSSQSYSRLGLAELIPLLREGVANGTIQLEEPAERFDFLPMLAEETITSLEDDAINYQYKSEVLDAIKEGLGLRKPNYLEELAEFHFEFLAKFLISRFFLPFGADRAMELRFAQYLVHYSVIAPVFSKALENFSNSISDDDSLSEFIYLYTAGQILTENPRGWMKSFSRALETGKPMLPESQFG